MLQFIGNLIEEEKYLMPTGWIIFIIVTVILIGALIGLTIAGKKLQKKQEESETTMRQGAQIMSIFVIDKSRKKLIESGLPQIVIDQTPKYLRRSRVPLVRAKVGPKVMMLMCDEKAFSLIPEKKEVKVLMNGIYIVEAKSARGGLEAPPVKKNLRQKLQEKYQSLRNKEKEEEGKTSKKSKKKSEK